MALQKKKIAIVRVILLTPLGDTMSLANDLVTYVTFTFGCIGVVFLVCSMWKFIEVMNQVDKE